MPIPSPRHLGGARPECQAPRRRMAGRSRRQRMVQQPGMVRGLPFARGHRSYGRRHRLWLFCCFHLRPAGGRDFLRRAASTEPSAAERGIGFPSGAYVADKGFEGEENHRRWLECYGVRIIHPPKRNSRKPWPKRLRRWVARMRQIVESVYDKLFNTFGLWRERPHEVEGLRARLAARVALHNFCTWLNDQLGRPRLAFADLLGW